MCGIAGYVDFSGRAPDPGLLRAMATSIAHRGPDADGVWTDGPCGLAHRRLSIIDLALSRQPMVHPGGALALTYNGEVYNYQELRTKLQADGASFSTQGDTEVVLNALHADWDGALDRLDGMFAIGAWDRTEQRLLLARDPMGIKPLFYAQPRPDLLVFGSEIKAVLLHPEVQPELDVDGIRDVMRFRAVYGQKTLYRGIRQVPPGSHLTFSRAGCSEGRYFAPAQRRRDTHQTLTGQSEAELVAQGRVLLEDAVRKRLVADVPVGAFLSGGLDSSLIVALMRGIRAEGEEVCTFSVGFRGDPHNEQGFARTVAQKFGTQHTEVNLDEREYAESFVPMSLLRDAPISEPADLAIAKMSRVARETVKVVLSGEGADEIFCGYPKYGFAGAPWALRRLMRLAGPQWVERVGGLLGMERRRVGIVARALAHPAEVDRLVQWFSYLDRSQLTNLLPGIGWADDEWAATTRMHVDVLREFEDADATARMQGLDCASWLPGNLLERGDRMTMAHGLEARVPFLDRALVPFGLALDRGMKCRGRSRKWIVKEWARELLPDEITQRRKWGFRVPLAQWFRGSMREMLETFLGASDGLCGTYGDARAIRGLLDDHLSGESDHSLALWTLLSAEVWYQEAFRRSALGRPQGVPAQ